MGVLGTVADIAIIPTVAPIFTAAFVWTRTQLERRTERRTAREARNWSGYVDAPGVTTWYVKVIEDPNTSGRNESCSIWSTRMALRTRRWPTFCVYTPMRMAR